MFLVWPRPELSCVVTRNETLSGYRYYMFDRCVLTIKPTKGDLAECSFGGGGTVHLLNRQPAHLNDTGNLKQTLGSPSQKIVFLLLLL